MLLGGVTILDQNPEPEPNSVGAETKMDFPVRIAQSRATRALWESTTGLKCHIRSTGLSQLEYPVPPRNRTLANQHCFGWGCCATAIRRMTVLEFYMIWSDPLPLLRGAVLRFSSPLLFRRVGKGCRVYGRIRFPRPLQNIIIGSDCMLGDSMFFQTGRNAWINIGNRCSINTSTHIVAAERITIGDDVAIGEFVSIRDCEHKFSSSTGVRDQGYLVAPIIIEPRVWIGRGVYIGPGVVIRSGSIIGANSVVRGQFPPNVLIAGVPGAVKKNLAD
jgi:carbonic anhydrase/acetyltransferase-like protein (isoleucine patch superfamily)